MEDSPLPTKFVTSTCPLYFEKIDREGSHDILKEE
jgi:hypothetical protein